MDDDSRVIDTGWDALPDYASKSGDADDAVTVSLSTTPGEWLVNTSDSIVVPMSMVELVEGLRDGKLTVRSLVWRAGMQEWAPVDKVPQLKLAARLPITSAAPSAAAPRPTPSKPPPKPVRSSTPAPPSSVAPSSVAPSSLGPQVLPSRKATLPFGLPTPAPSQSRPSHARPASSPRAASVPAPPSEEPGVLAVYARPAATISFDLSPEQPLRGPVSASSPSAPPAPPETLAPITTDSARRRAPTPRNPDLSVVAASEFREVQRSSKRLVWLSSLGSAAAASLLTFWLANRPVTVGAAAHASEPVATLAPAPVAPVAAPAVVVTPAPSAVAPAPSAATLADAAVAKPKPAHKARAVSVAPTPKPRATDDASAQLRDPASDNPYAVKLDDEASAAKTAPAATTPPAPRAPAPDAVKDSDATGSTSSTAGF